MAQLVCGGCHTLLMYIRGATSVQCSCCHTVNLALEDVYKCSRSKSLTAKVMVNMVVPDSITAALHHSYHPPPCLINSTSGGSSHIHLYRAVFLRVNIKCRFFFPFIFTVLE
ncbi:Protein LOL1, partial [Cucurbita argyrosperma subsp. argyrosperma]